MIMKKSTRSLDTFTLIMQHNFPHDYKNGDFFYITGNLHDYQIFTIEFQTCIFVNHGYWILCDYSILVSIWNRKKE